MERVRVRGIAATGGSTRPLQSLEQREVQIPRQGFTERKRDAEGEGVRKGQLLTQIAVSGVQGRKRKRERERSRCYYGFHLEEELLTALSNFHRLQSARGPSSRLCSFLSFSCVRSRASKVISFISQLCEVERASLRSILLCLLLCSVSVCWPPDDRRSSVLTPSDRVKRK